MSQIYRYEPRILRVNLTTGAITREKKDAAWGRKYVGGMGFGTRLPWEELPPETAWNSSDNKLIFSLGALTGTTVCGSGLCCVNTIGSLTNGLSSAQTLGHWGACLRRAGYDILIVEGEAPEWQYLFLGEDTVELRPADWLLGKDTWETEDALKERLGLPGRESSVACIGPAGEHGVRFAGIFNDKGHLASSNGPGTVMGHKKLKAIAIQRLDREVEVADPEELDRTRQLWFDDANASTASGKSKVSGTRYVGTLGSLNMMHSAHLLPIKNYTSTDFPTCGNFNRDKLASTPGSNGCAPPAGPVPGTTVTLWRSQTASTRGWWGMNPNMRG